MSQYLQCQAISRNIAACKFEKKGFVPYFFGNQWFHIPIVSSWGSNGPQKLMLPDNTWMVNKHCFRYLNYCARRKREMGSNCASIHKLIWMVESPLSAISFGGFFFCFVCYFILFFLNFGINDLVTSTSSTVCEASYICHHNIAAWLPFARRSAKIALINKLLVPPLCMQ